MSILAQQTEQINVPTDPASYRDWLDTLDQRAYVRAFGVVRGATLFRCPTNGRQYLDAHPVEQEGCVWTRCFWCDANLHIRLRDPDFDRTNAQRHCYPLVEVADV